MNLMRWNPAVDGTLLSGAARRKRIERLGYNVPAVGDEAAISLDGAKA
jgi:hypothetical protein